MHLLPVLRSSVIIDSSSPLLLESAAWLLRKIIFGYHILETSVFVDAPRAKIRVE